MQGPVHRTQISPAFVKEAYSLLRQSIIHVEKDDIGLDEEDEEQDVEMEEAAAGAPNGHAHPPPSSALGPSQSSPLKGQGAAVDPTTTTPRPAAGPKKAKVVISYEKYMGIMTLVVTKLSEEEQRTGSGIARSELAQWYLEEVEDSIGTVDELESEKALIQKVLTRLVKVRPCPTEPLERGHALTPRTGKVPARATRRDRGAASRRRGGLGRPDHGRPPRVQRRRPEPMMPAWGRAEK